MILKILPQIEREEVIKALSEDYESNVILANLREKNPLLAVLAAIRDGDSPENIQLIILD